MGKKITFDPICLRCMRGRPGKKRFSSTPPVPPSLPSDLTASQAITYAINNLASDTDLNTQFGFTNGSFDSNPANAMLLQLPGDASTEGDWLVPYEGIERNRGRTGILESDPFSRWKMCYEHPFSSLATWLCTHLVMGLNPHYSHTIVCR